MAKLTQGETLTITLSVTDAVAVAVKIGGPATSTHNLTQSGQTWAANIATGQMPPGSYVVQTWATYSGGIQRIVSKDSLTIERPVHIGEMRSNAEKALEMIDAMLTGQAKEGVKRYKINSRELERYSVPELLKLRSHFAAEVQKERRLAKGISGLGPRIAVRF